MGLEDIDGMRVCAALLPPPGDGVVVECLDEIAALRAQLAAAEERARHFEMSSAEAMALVLSHEGHIDKMEKQLAAAREAGAREFEKLIEDEVGIAHKEMLARYLSSRGFPSARPDDGRVAVCPCEFKNEDGCADCDDNQLDADGEVKP